MKGIILILSIVLVYNKANAQEDLSSFKIYNDTINTSLQVAKAVTQARAERKNIFVEVGGNWCKWCKRFNDFTTNDKEIDSLINANYVVLHINYSKENKNMNFMKHYEFPQRFGFPVFMILDERGRRMNTQNSAYLEAKETFYDRDKVLDFLKAWTPAALDGAQYEK